MYPVTLQYGIKRGLCPVADDLWERAVSLSLSQWWTPGDCRNGV
jgi:hypothetical protein